MCCPVLFWIACSAWTLLPLPTPVLRCAATAQYSTTRVYCSAGQCLRVPTKPRSTIPLEVSKGRPHTTTVFVTRGCFWWFWWMDFLKDPLKAADGGSRCFPFWGMQVPGIASLLSYACLPSHFVLLLCCCNSSGCTLLQWMVL